LSRSLEDKRALVTGGSKGIGRAIAPGRSIPTVSAFRARGPGYTLFMISARLSEQGGFFFLGGEPLMITKDGYEGLSALE
jgi:hypothetical protein